MPLRITRTPPLSSSSNPHGPHNPHVSFLEAPENPACPFPQIPKPMYVTPVPFLRPELPQRKPHSPSQMATPSNRLAETSMVSGRDSATLQQRRGNFLNAQRRHDQKQRLKNKSPDDGPPRPALLQRRVHLPRAAAREHRGRGANAAAAPPQTSADPHGPHNPHVSFLEAPENPACPFPLIPKPMYVTPVPFLRPELPQRKPHPPSQMTFCFALHMTFFFLGKKYISS